MWSFKDQDAENKCLVHQPHDWFYPVCWQMESDKTEDSTLVHYLHLDQLSA